MAQRRFGPTLGAGVVVIEKEAEKLIEAAPLGVTLHITPLEKGDPTKLISCFSKRDMIRKVGGLISGFDGPDCGQDFWDHSNGSGELHLLRVVHTAGGLRKAEIDILSREMVDGVLSPHGARPVMRVKAKSGGRWGSRKRTIWRETPTLGDIGTTTLNTVLGPASMLQDEWVDGVVRLDGVPTKEYKIVGNTVGGIISVSSDSDMAADLAAGLTPLDQGYTLELRVRTGPDGLKRALAVELGDGEQDPTNEFSLNIYVNEELSRRYPNLSMDPASVNYFLRIINDDTGNDDIVVEDLLSPSNPAPTDRRPANEQAIIAAITATTLTSKLIQARNLSVAPLPDPSISVGPTTDAFKYRDTLRFEVIADGPTATIRETSSRIGGGSQVHADITAPNAAAQVFAFNTPESPIIPPIQLTTGATVWKVGDIIEVDYMPFEPKALVGGTLVPDLVNAPRKRFRIIDNNHRSIVVQTGDLIVDGLGAVNDRFMAFYPQQLGGVDRVGPVATNGYDALAGLADLDYTTTHLNPDTSPARGLVGQNKGLVKVATPDRNSTTVVKQGLQFAERFNWQYRMEIPDNITTEDAAIAHINDTIGRNDFGVCIFPSYADVQDPERPGQLKRVPMTGMIHGREALMAKNFDGYHKAAAGIEVTLPKVSRLPMDTLLNEEALNPQGINVVKKIKGNFIIWGDRTISIDPAWKFKHQREQMSHYENRLREGFDFIIFALNDTTTQAQLLVTLQAMFLPEFTKGAVRGKDLADAVRLKIDSENNTDATRAAGDLFADISLRLADTVERFIIRIGKAGIFEGTSN